MWNHRKCIQEAVFSRPRSQSFTGPDLNATFEALPWFPHFLRIMQNIYKEGLQIYRTLEFGQFNYIVLRDDINGPKWSIVNCLMYYLGPEDNPEGYTYAVLLLKIGFMWDARGGQTFSISVDPVGGKIAPWRRAEGGIKARSVKEDVWAGVMLTPIGIL